MSLNLPFSKTLPTIKLLLSLTRTSRSCGLPIFATSTFELILVISPVITLSSKLFLPYFLITFFNVTWLCGSLNR